MVCHGRCRSWHGHLAHGSLWPLPFVARASCPCVAGASCPCKGVPITVEIHSFVLGPFETNSYLLLGERTVTGGDGPRDAWVIDPSMGAERLIEAARRAGAGVRWVLLTHGHADHIAGIGQLRRVWPDLKIACPRADVVMLTDARANLSAEFNLPVTVGPADELLEAGRTLVGEGFELTVIATPGHTPGGVSFHCPQLGAVFTGDALFAGSVGRSDLPGGDHEQLIASIRRGLLSLGDDTQVLPGHGPATTIGQERRTNPFLLL